MPSSTETFHRLEAMGNAGLIDAARATLAKSPPVLAELGLSADRAAEMIDAPLTQLESVGGSPSMLEAIVKAVGRPPLVVRGGVVEGKHTLSDDFPADVDIRIGNVEPLLGSVGRIEFLNHDLAWGGTGWVIADKGDHILIVTNRHVANIVARRTFRGDGIYMFAPANVPYGAQIDFVEEVGAVAESPAVHRIDKFTYIAEDAAADIALGRIAKPAGRAPAVVPLTLADADGGDGELVAVVGYPARDSLRNDEVEMERYFRGLYDVKRFSPGFLAVQGGVSVLKHDCTTLGGNSGSPVISLTSGKVVGLHFAGRYGIGNSAVRASTLKALLDGTRPTSLGVPAVAGQESTDGTHAASHFDGREGYDPDFLQVAPVPLPKVPAGIALSRPSDATDERPHELRYQNFGVLYSGALKNPIVTALNIDGALTHRQKRQARWFADLRIPAAEQLGKADYDDGAIDRGHLIRRAATNWGETEAQAKLSNADSFHYTVASPQHMTFNRSKTLWLGLENYVMDNVRTHGFRCCVFSGPILQGDEPPLKDTGAPIPLRFFKVVSMLAEEDGSNGILRLHCTAYVLSQADLIQRLLIDEGFVEAAEGFEFGAYRTYQVRLKDLEALSGLSFDPGMIAADPLERTLKAAEQEGHAPLPFVTVDDLESIVL